MSFKTDVVLGEGIVPIRVVVLGGVIALRNIVFVDGGHIPQGIVAYCFMGFWASRGIVGAAV
jgi:hypothetical protein